MSAVFLFLNTKKGTSFFLKFPKIPILDSTYITKLLPMPNLTLVNFQEVDKKHVFTFANCTPESAAREFANLKQSLGYKIETGDPYRGTYGVGSTVMRILFGAFVKRYTFDHAIYPNGNDTVLEYKKGMTGISGGVIGLAKMNSEFSKISVLIRNL